ncbi:MAG: hypothetical protein H0U87_08035 [Acidobacteria bacterium]|nr:hypothetical protein [Acidobacteriota bacterium]
MNCNVCGSEKLIKGTILGMTGNGGTGSTGFMPGETPFFNKWFTMVGREIQSYGCIHCGNLQFSVEFSEEDKQQHLEFHGQPPSVTENPDDEK